MELITALENVLQLIENPYSEEYSRLWDLIEALKYAKKTERETALVSEYQDQGATKARFMVRYQK